jgi:hypothetical protein
MKCLGIRWPEVESSLPKVKDIARPSAFSSAMLSISAESWAMKTV